MWRLPVSGSSWMMSVPVMSDGIRSGVNWMRANFRSSTSAIVRTSSVFARPGTPTMRLLPPANSVSITCSMTAACPMMTLPSSATIRSRLVFIRSARATSSAASRTACDSRFTCISCDTVRGPGLALRLAAAAVRSGQAWRANGPGLGSPNVAAVVSPSVFCLLSSVCSCFLLLPSVSARTRCSSLPACTPRSTGRWASSRCPRTPSIPRRRCCSSR